MKGSKCAYCSKKVTDTLYAPYCSRVCSQEVARKRGSNPDGSTSPSDVARLVRQVRKIQDKKK